MEWNNAFELPFVRKCCGKSKFGCYVGVIVNASYLTSQPTVEQGTLTLYPKL